MNTKDTSREAGDVLVDIYRRMSPATKAVHIFDGYRTGRMLAMAGLKQSHSEATEKKIWLLWAKRHLGEKLFNEVYGEVLDG